VPHPTLWLNLTALDGMIVEADRAAPHETGGMLLGWENDKRNEIVVAMIVGPGPNALHTPTAFQPDAEWQQERLDAEYERSAGRVTYLGDWHVHPRGGFGMSRRDRRTMAKTARHADARCPYPLMGLIACTDDSYQVGVWRWAPTRWRPFKRGTAIALAVREWEPTDDEARWTS
jgi:integrative and conjugative element protein (TIGR02256 family)